MFRVKICGITTPEDMALAADAGADAVGLNFHPSSPRFVDPRSAATLVRFAPPLLATVGIFVTHSLRQAAAIAYQMGLRAIQWYGPAEPGDDTFPFGLIHAIRVRTA